MGASNSSNQQTVFYKLKIVKDIDTPFFFRKEKKGDVYVEAEQFDTIQGYLTKIETGGYVFEGKEKKTFKIFMNDDAGDGRLSIESGFTYMTRSMLNSIDGATSIGLVKLTARKWGKTEKKYPTVFVEVNGQKTKWAYEIKDLPQVEEIKNKKNEVVSRDDDELNQFFIDNIIPSINSKVVSEFQVTSEMGKATGQGVYVKTDTPYNDLVPDTSDDLPF